jgi:hypothetical protein
VNLHVQLVHCVLGPADGDQKPVVVQKTAPPHPLLEPIQIAQHRSELVLQCPGLFGRQIVAVHRSLVRAVLRVAIYVPTATGKAIRCAPY